MIFTNVRFRPRLCEYSIPFFQVGVHYHYLPKTNMSSQLGTVAGLLLKAKCENFLALREISEFSHSLGQKRSLAITCGFAGSVAGVARRAKTE